jgi:GTP cyclohydrolase IA
MRAKSPVEDKRSASQVAARTLGNGRVTTEQEAKAAVRTLLTYIGEDIDREGLLETPERVVRAWDELTCGYGQDPAQILATDFHGNGYDEMVVCRDIAFHSVCEHHLLSFSGVAHVAYVPRGRVVGLSKMARLVDCFARRLQIQEKLTQQVAEAMRDALKPRGVGVTIRAKHLCMSCRGVMKDRAEMVTTCLLGVFKKHEVREEFFLHCR